MTQEKLSNIRGDLVCNDPEWESWDFVKFTEALRLWTRRNPVDNFKQKSHTCTGNVRNPIARSKPSRVNLACAFTVTRSTSSLLMAT